MVRRAPESQLRYSGASLVEAARPSSSSSATTPIVSVIVRSLLPFAPPDAEETQQRRAKQERDHRHRDRGALAELRAWDGSLERQCRHQMSGVEGAATGDC